MKRTLFTLLIALTFTAASAQTNLTGLANFGINSNSNGLFTNTPTYTDFSLQMGTSFGSFGGNGSVLSSYVSPNLNFDVTPKLNISAGALIINNNFSNFQQSPVFAQSPILNQNMTDSYLYVQGDYKLNEKFTLSGGALKKVNASPYQQQMNPMAKNYDYSAYNVGMRYKVNENAHIEAQFNFIQGNPYNSPFINYGSPYGNFYSPFGGFNNPSHPFD